MLLLPLIGVGNAFTGVTGWLWRCFGDVFDELDDEFGLLLMGVRSAESSRKPESLLSKPPSTKVVWLELWSIRSRCRRSCSSSSGSS